MHCSGCIADVATKTAIDRKPSIRTVNDRGMGGIWIYVNAEPEQSKPPRKKDAPLREEKQNHAVTFGKWWSDWKPRENWAEQFQTRPVYWKYFRFACRVCKPLPPELFELLTKKGVEKYWERWAEKITKVKKLAVWAGVEDDHQGAWSRRKRPHQPDDILLADVFAAGLFIGELRSSGEVCPVRPHVLPIRGEHKVTLRIRTCACCQRLLTSALFSKKRNSIREICRRCDNARRRA